MPRATFLMVAALGVMTLPAFGADDLAPQWRADGVSVFDAALCAGTASDLTAAAQRAGLYDGQIEGVRLTSRDGRPVDLDSAKMRARSIARVKRYGGYAAGQCIDGSAWAAAFPAPAGVKIIKDDIQLPVKSLQKLCSDWTVDLATNDGVERLPATANVTLPKNKDGMLSVTCQPRRPRWQGPVAWFLIPAGQGPGAAAPHTDLLSLKAATPEAEVATRLRTWINAIRADVHVGPLTAHVQLNNDAELLAIDTSVAHDRLLLKRIANGLSAHQLRFIGENRARAADLSRVAWLLWNSPRHRALLLDKEATHAGVAVKQVRGELLAVIVAAGGSRITTSKAGNNAGSKTF